MNSNYFQVSVSIDRLLGIKFMNWNKRFFYGNRITYFALSLIILCFSYNIYFSLDNGYVSYENGTETIFCNKPKSGNWDILNAWFLVIKNNFLNVLVLNLILFKLFQSFLFLYSILPFALLLLFNSLIIKTVISSRHNISQSVKRQRKMAFTVLSVSFLFIITSLPTASIQGETIGYLLSFDLGQLIVTCCNSIVFTYQASNFWILSATNGKFRMRVKKMLCFSKTDNSIFTNSNFNSNTLHRNSRRSSCRGSSHLNVPIQFKNKYKS